MLRWRNWGLKYVSVQDRALKLCPAWKTCFLFALMLSRRVSDLLDLSFCSYHSWGWRSCTFSYLPDFVAKTQNLSVHDTRFDEFTIPSLDDFVVGDWDELLLCPIRARKYLARPEQDRLVFLASLYLRRRGRRGCPKTPSLSVSGLSSTLLILQLLQMNAEFLGSRNTRSGRSPHHCSLEGAVQSIRY